MIESTGKNLNILILSHTEQSWEAFSSWFSFSKNLPEAEVVIIFHRSKKREFQVCQWLKRLGIKHLFHKEFSEDVVLNRLWSILTSLPKFENNHPLLVVDCDVMATAELPPIDPTNFIGSEDDKVWLLNGLCVEDIRNMINNFHLKDHFTHGFDVINDNILFSYAKSEKTTPLVSWLKGCGNWIHKVGCPFSVASRFDMDDMTLNEIRLTELWKKMGKLFTATR